MTSKGLEVSGKVEVVKAPSKKARQKQLEAKVMEMDPPNITKNRIAKDLKLTDSQAYLLLKSMTDSGKLIKYGRGAQAVWKKAQ